MNAGINLTPRDWTWRGSELHDQLDNNPREDWREVAACYQNGAAANDPEALNGLAIIQYTYAGAPAEAVLSWEKAAEAGSQEAAQNLLQVVSSDPFLARRDVSLLNDILETRKCTSQRPKAQGNFPAELSKNTY